MEFPEVCIWKRAPRYRFTSAWGRMIFRRWRQIMLGSCSLSLCTTPTEMKGSEMLSVYTGQRIFSHTRAYTHACAHAHTDRHTNTHAILSFRLCRHVLSKQILIGLYKNRKVFTHIQIHGWHTQTAFNLRKIMNSAPRPYNSVFISPSQV